MNKFDVVIIGGGMVGAALAVGWAKQGRQVAVVETATPQAFDETQPMDVRISAISQTSVDLLSSLGAWSAINEMRVCPYRRLETWEHPECRTRFNSEDLGLDQLGYMVENRIIQLGLWQQFSTENITLFCPDRLASIQGEDEKCITLESGDQLYAPWVIGADGANSKVRNIAGIGVTAWDYRQSCMLINVTTELPQQDITWQQFFPSGPRSFLPLSGHQGSLVWYDSPSRIKQLSLFPSEQLRQEILRYFPAELGDVQVQQHGHFPLTRRHAQNYVKNRCVVIGDAAHTINPLAGQGVNLGFKDVSVLLEATEGHSALTLKQFQAYERRRRPDNLLMQSGMDVFYKAFSNELTPLKLARNALLKVAEHSGPIKKQVLRYALGLN